ncbi:hypothetical protein T4C_4824 [Trichinella pseudospiralis]|uniref:Uncharacterized protein n=1 Tax=Trichinella pseudospiralis TaxID=6337 RepID=A0A0V1K708_TRIPS|nr:hypothetical protein T4C_4824 [Trichinella pseudospiralis]
MEDARQHLEDDGKFGKYILLSITIFSDPYVISAISREIRNLGTCDQIHSYFDRFHF